MCIDRVGSSSLPLTQELLSLMLGTRRSSVTLAAGMLQKAGLIRYTRGNIKVVDVPKLGQSACECFGLMHGSGNDGGGNGDRFPSERVRGPCFKPFPLRRLSARQ